MTNWTDLIDTDPVAAAKLYIEQHQNVADDDKFRLMSNLAALCETMANLLRGSLECHGVYPNSTDEIIAKAMKKVRNPDGSRRFPEVK